MTEYLVERNEEAVLLRVNTHLWQFRYVSNRKKNGVSMEAKRKIERRVNTKRVQTNI